MGFSLIERLALWLHDRLVACGDRYARRARSLKEWAERRYVDRLKGS